VNLSSTEKRVPLDPRQFKSLTNKLKHLAESQVYCRKKSTVKDDLFLLGSVGREKQKRIKEESEENKRRAGNKDLARRAPV
jgi:hypothetical protein